ncbi:MAG: dockerin type I repeat-containing protein [Spirochaetales bacterium]|nr:dockerin type I repeat-containing protein [Spirochaetales bacterium]
MNSKKRMRSLLFPLFFLCLIFLLPPSFITAQAGLLGDVNDDSVIDIIDALLVAQYYVEMNPANFISENADVNSNGLIDIVDALLIAQYYVGIIDDFTGTSTPAPTPGPTLPPREVSINENFTMNYGETVKLTGFDFYIRFWNVSDSRCPSEDLCVWEGEVETAFDCRTQSTFLETIYIKAPPAEPDSELVIHTISSDMFYYYTINCRGVDPYPRTSLERIPLEDYVVTLMIMVAIP